MEKIAWLNLHFTLIYSTVFNIIFLSGELQSMEWWQALLVAVCPAVIYSATSAFIMVYTSKNSQDRPYSD